MGIPLTSSPPLPKVSPGRFLSLSEVHVKAQLELLFPFPRHVASLYAFQHLAPLPAFGVRPFSGAGPWREGGCGLEAPADGLQVPRDADLPRPCRTQPPQEAGAEAQPHQLPKHHFIFSVQEEPRAGSLPNAPSTAAGRRAVGDAAPPSHLRLQRARKINSKDTKATLATSLLSFPDLFAKLHWAKSAFWEVVV